MKTALSRHFIKPVIYKALRTAAIIYLIVVAILSLFQDQFLLHPPKEGVIPFNVQGVTVADWKPEGAYHGIVIEPSGLAPRATLVFYHGNADTADDRRWIGATIAKKGFRVVLAEYAGFGRRPGIASSDTVLNSSQDAFRAVRTDFKGPYILSGESLGAGMASQVALAQGDAAEAVLLFTPWDSLLKVVQEKFPFVPARWLLHHEFSSERALEHLGKPVLVAAAEQDQVIPPHHAVALSKAVPTSAFVWLNGVGHGNWFEAVTMPVGRTGLTLQRA
jgi:pimeloyl-ACP methyl ester carboxylesterase